MGQTEQDADAHPDQHSRDQACPDCVIQMLWRHGVWFQTASPGACPAARLFDAHVIITDAKQGVARHFPMTRRYGESACLTEAGTDQGRIVYGKWKLGKFEFAKGRDLA